MSSSAGMLIIYVVAFIAIFYFMAIRPQQRQRRAHAALLSSLKKGDHVITASGIYGTVKRVEESLVVVEVAKGVSLKLARNAIAQIVRDDSSTRAFASEPSGRRGKNAPREIEEETYVEEVAEVAEEEEVVEEIVDEAAAEDDEEVVEEVIEEADAEIDTEVAPEDEESKDRKA